MAYPIASARTSSSLIERAVTGYATVLHAASRRYAAYCAYLRVHAELATLSDRELDDLDLSRSKIRGLALETAYRTAGS